MATETFRVRDSRLRGGAALRAQATPTTPGVVTLEGTLQEGTRFASGWGMNLLSRCVTPPEMYPAADTTRPASNLWDGRPGRPARFSATDAAPRITADLDILGQGGGEDATDPDAWTIPDDLTAPDFTWVQATSGPHVGTGLLYMTNTSGTGRGTGRVYKDVRVRAGERLSLSASAISNAPGEHARISLQNRANGRFLNASGEWVNGQEYVLDTVNAGWEDVALDFLVESLEECNGWDTVYLRWECSKTEQSAFTAGFDGMALWPATGFLGVWYPQTSDIGSLQALKNYGSTTGDFSGEQVEISSLLLRRGVSFHDYSETPQNFRYHRIVLESESEIGDDPVEFGEVVLSNLSELSADRAVGLQPDAKIDVLYPQASFENSAGESFRYLERDTSTRKATIIMRLITEEEVDRFTNWLHGQGRGGAQQSILVFSTRHGSDVCLYGRFDADPLRKTLIIPRESDGGWCVELEIGFQESPGPVS